MSRVLLSVVVLLAVVAMPLAAQPAAPPSALCLDPNATDFPDSSLADFSALHDRPTGSHGRVFAGTDGHFYFEDGTRARFWGINVAKGSVFAPRPVVDRAIAAIERAGFNLVRFHHLDDVEGLLPAESAGTAQRLADDKLALLDYWIAELGKRGIYAYLDLLDYRTFYESEEVANAAALGRGAKPYAFFDRRLILLQQQYARKFLVEHINPYTGLSYGADPTVALIELCDENGFFAVARNWRDLVAPYRDELQRRWNEWLLGRYGDTPTLAEAWTDADSRCGLLPGEALEQGTVQLFPDPARPGEGSADQPPNADPEAGQTGRVADRRLFLTDLHRQYFRAMRDYLRGHGVDQPLTAVTDFLHLSDLRSVAEELDFIGCNFYYDHPSWQRGNEWHLPAFFENVNPLADPRLESFVPRVCASRVYGKPLAVREWNYCWPNKFRGAGFLEAAVYGALQDLDALILFTYDVKPGQRQLEFFDVRCDPARWGLAGMAASIFLQRQVAPAQQQVAVAYSAVDTHYPTHQPYPTEVYKLGWVSQLSSLFFDQELAKAPDLVLASGRTSGSAYKGDRTVICGNWPASDLLDHRRDQSPDQLSGYDVATVPERTQYFTFGGTMFPAGSRHRLSASPGYLLADVQHHEDYRPIGIGEDGETCLGFRDMRRSNYVFRRLGAAQQLRVALDALAQLHNAPVGNEMVDTGRFVSDTGQVRRLVDAELLLVDAPQAQVIAGSLRQASLTRTPQLSLTTATPIGALVWVSLDGRPVAASTRWVLKLTSTATNTDETKQLHHTNPERTTFSLTALGKPPVTTLGEPAATPTTVDLDGKQVLAVHLVNGVWELLVEGGVWTFYCDTPGVTFRLPQLRPEVTVTRVLPTGEAQRERQTQPLTYPSGVAMLRVTN